MSHFFAILVPNVQTNGQNKWSNYEKRTMGYIYFFFSVKFSSVNSRIRFESVRQSAYTYPYIHSLLNKVKEKKEITHGDTF